jgi:hypothetical protein
MNDMLVEKIPNYKKLVPQTKNYQNVTKVFPFFSQKIGKFIQKKKGVCNIIFLEFFEEKNL